MKLLEKSKYFLNEELLKGDFRANRINSAMNDANPTTLIRMKSGFLFLMDKQFIPGYCILSNYPQVNELNDLSMEDREIFLKDMNIVGEAISLVVEDYKRMNYSILGNSDNYLHAHIYPRYNWEPEERVKMPVWLYDKDNFWTNIEYEVSKKDEKLGNAIADKVIELCKKYY